MLYEINIKQVLINLEYNLDIITGAWVLVITRVKINLTTRRTLK